MIKNVQLWTLFSWLSMTDGYLVVEGKVDLDMNRTLELFILHSLKCEWS